LLAEPVYLPHATTPSPRRAHHPVNHTPTSDQAGGTTTAKIADTASRNAALALAFALPGDTLLYLLLPIYAASFGVTLPEAGLLLAANRLIRIVAYGWVARLYSRLGPRTICTMAAASAVVSTLIFAAFTGVWLLLVGRLLWGLSYAAMNVANQALPTAVMEGAIARNARARAIIAFGPMTSLLIGAPLTLAIGPNAVFLVFGVVALTALFFARRIPPLREPTAVHGPRFERPGPMSIWSFSMGFTIDGLFMFGLGLLAAASFPKGAVLAAGAAMALRYGCDIVCAPVGGRIGQQFGALPALITLSLLTAGALLMLAGGDPWLLWSGVVAVILFRSTGGPLAAPVVAQTFPGPARIAALARQATWRDIGAGTGPLAAGVLFPIAAPLAIYGAGALILGAASLLLLRLHERT
jgi:DHA1 family inner membrane transport protein